MSIRLSVLTLSLGAALLTPFAASADNYPGSHFTNAGGAAKSRAEVVAELAAWRQNPVHADGWAEIGGGDTLRFVGIPAGTGVAKTRAEVKTELAAWRKNMVLPDGWAEIGGDHEVFVGHPGPGRSRAEVEAEFKAWRKNPVSHDGYRELGGDTQERVSGNGFGPAIRLAALNGFTLASGLASDESRYALTQTAVEVDKMHVHYAAKPATEARPAPEVASRPTVTGDATQASLARLFNAR